MHVALVVTAAPLAERAGDLVDALAAAGHQVTVCPTPTARDWLGGVPEQLLLAGRIRPATVIVCPATFNTINRWAAGANDHPALGVLNDALGLHTPTLAVPMVADRLAAHPAWAHSTKLLHHAGVTYLDPSNGTVGPQSAHHASGAGGAIAANFRPSWLLDWLTNPLSRPSSAAVDGTSQAEPFSDLLEVLTADRRAHSRAVGRKVAGVAQLAPAPVRADLIAAATLHDIGYGHPATGFHPLDGARYLAGLGFPATVCHLVAHHTASVLEAGERGIDHAVYDEFHLDADLRIAHSLLWWADLTTGPTGQTVTVENRLDEIRARYGPHNVVTRFADRARPVLLAAGQSPTGLSQGAEGVQPGLYPAR